MAIKKYKVTGFRYRFNGGLIGLTGEQARSRRNIASGKGDGVYECAACDFREGEIIGLEESSVTPSDLKQLVLADAEQARETRKKTARATIGDILLDYPDIAEDLMERGRKEGRQAAEAEVEQAVYQRGYDQGYADGKAEGCTLEGGGEGEVLPVIADSDPEAPPAEVKVEASGDKSGHLFDKMIGGAPETKKKRGGN